MNYPNASYVHTDPLNAEEANWTKDVTDWSTIHSFKLVLKDDTIFVKGQDITLTFDMKAPEKGDKTNLPDESILFTNINDAKRTEENEKKAAWNSFAVTTNGLLPTEPERVGVVLFDNGGAVRVKYFIEGTDTELDNPDAGDRVKNGETDAGWYTVKDPNTTIGEKYETDNKTLKPEFLKDKDGKTYQLTAKEVRADSDPKNGNVEKDTQYIIYEYKLVEETPNKPETPEEPHNDEPKNNTPKPEEKKTQSPTTKTNTNKSKQTKSKAVKTGDDTVLWIYVLLAGISILGALLLLRRSKKSSRL